jgi:hypothetical protein
MDSDELGVLGFHLAMIFYYGECHFLQEVQVGIHIRDGFFQDCLNLFCTCLEFLQASLIYSYFSELFLQLLYPSIIFLVLAIQIINVAFCCHGEPGASKGYENWIIEKILSLGFL